MNLETWQVGPDNRWAYQHVEELLPVAPIAAGAGAPLPEGPGEPVAGDEALDRHWVDGILVLRDGARVFERYRNGMGPQTLHLSQSVAKSALGLLAGALALDPAEPVEAYVPEVAGSGYAGATLGHLLDMTASVDFVEDYEAGFWRYDVACGWHPPAPGADAETILDFLREVGPGELPHGAGMHYVTPNTDLLGIAAERAGGAPLAELLARELWGPMGAEHAAALTLDPAGTAAIGGGLCATLGDYARMGELVRRDGAGVVPAAWIAGLGDGDPGAFARRPDPEAPGLTGYAGLWWRAGERVLARGIHGQLVAVDRGAGTVVAILSSWPRAMEPAAERWQQELVAAVSAR